jgi:probable HAF family extracellular repeat protein
LGLPPGVASGYSIPYGINNDGLVIGDVVFGLPDGSSASRSFRWSEESGMALLEALPGGSHGANAINETGQVAGVSGTTSIPSQRVARWSATGEIEDLGVPAENIFGFGRDINNDGDIAVSAVDSFHRLSAYLYTDELGYRNLGNLGSEQAQAWGINDFGQVVGSSALPAVPGTPANVHAFVWSEVAGMDDLGVLPGGTYSHANAINNAGLIVGQSEVSPSTSHAFLYRHGTMFDLNSLIDASEEWTLSIAWDISNTGLIVGWGTRNGEARSFLLRPVPEPSAFTLVLVTYAVFGCANLRYRHATSGPPVPLDRVPAHSAQLPTSIDAQ